MKHYSNPEIISTSRLLDKEGDDALVGDRVTGVQVLFDDGNHREGTVQLDVRQFNEKKGESLIIEMPLSDLMAALTTATLNREDTSE